MNTLTNLLGGRQPALGVDFDGTIASHLPFPQIGFIKPHAAQSLQALKDSGWKIIIFTCRTREHQVAMIKWLRANHIPFDGVNFNPDCPEAFQKPMCDIYLDDRAVVFQDNWPDLPEIIMDRLLQLPKHIYQPTV